MKWTRYIVAAIVCLNLTTAAAAQLTLGANQRGTPRIISVSPGPTPEAAGNRLLAAVAAIDDATQFHPYVILLDPGDYDLGGESLVMKPWVSIRGSDRASTRISGNNSNHIIRTAGNTDIGGLTLEHRGGVVSARALYSYNVGYVTIHDAEIKASNSSDYVEAIYNQNASPVIRNVVVTASGLDDAIVNGIRNTDSASPRIWDTKIAVEIPENGMGSGIHCTNGSSPDLYDVAVQVTVGDSGRGQGMYFLGNCFPRIVSATIDVSGGDVINGIFISNDSLATIRDTRVRVFGKGTASEAYGIKCIGSSTFDMERGRISAQDAAKVAGVEGGSGSAGLVMAVRQSRVVSTGTSIRTAVDLTVRVASTVLQGPIDNWIRGPFRCINCVNQYYVPLDEDCEPLTP